MTATIDGKVVTWVNDWTGKLKVDASPPVRTQIPAEQPRPLKEQKIEVQPVSSASNEYSRIGYYNSVSQTLDDLIFLGNHGGQGSGVFDLQVVCWTSGNVADTIQ